MFLCKAHVVSEPLKDKAQASLLFFPRSFVLHTLPFVDTLRFASTLRSLKIIFCRSLFTTLLQIPRYYTLFGLIFSNTEAVIMKYSAILFALALGVAAIPQDQTSTITSAPSPTTTQSATEICLGKCDSADVTCQARCVGVARPNESQIAETTECAAKCDQGDGSPEATEKYADCQQACLAKYFPSSQTLSGELGKASDPAANPSGESPFL